MVLHYSEVQIDALQEITNIAMGQAGASLAAIFDIFVNLSVPKIQILDSDQVATSVLEMVGEESKITAVRQAFFDSIRGEAIMIYNQNGCKDLADLMGYGAQIDEKQERELLLDVSNILVGACLCGIAEQLDAELSFSPPSVLGLKIDVEDILRTEDLKFRQALLIEVNFKLEQRGFTSHLIILMPEDSIDLVRSSVNRLIESC
jgi:chemotaxis protein CheC